MTSPYDVVAQAIETEVDSESVREFGGTWGVVGIVATSHVVLYYLWIAWRYYGEPGCVVTILIRFFGRSRPGGVALRITAGSFVRESGRSPAC